MTKGTIFWVLMIIWLIFGVWSGYSNFQGFLMSGNLLLYALLFILGWKVFGSVVSD